MRPLALGVVVAYLLVALVLGLTAGRRGRGDVADFVAGERAFGPVVMYFVLGATIYSAYALLGTPQRVVSHGADVLYIFAYGAVGFVPLFFIGPKVRRIGAREGYVTQAELVGGRYHSRFVVVVMGVASILAFVPYVVIQLKAAGLVMAAITGWPPVLGAAIVYAVVTTYVIVGGVRGVGWTNVLQGVVMIVVVWCVGLALPISLYGGIGPMFERVASEAPAYLTLPGPEGASTPYVYTSEVLVSVLGFTMWPHLFMKCFTARSARLVQLSVALYPSFLLFLVPLVFLGFVAVLEGGPANDGVLLWLADLPARRGASGGSFVFAAVAFSVLAASMSTGDALLHAGGSIFVRDVLGAGLELDLDERTQTRVMRGAIVVLALVGVGVLAAAGSTSVVDLLLLAYAIPIQFLPLVLLGLYWRRAHRVGAEVGLGVGLATVVLLFGVQQANPGLYAYLNPAKLQIGVIGVVANALAMVGLGLVGSAPGADHLERFEL